MSANGTVDQDSITSHTKDLKKKNGIDTSLLNTQRYNVGIKGKVEQSKKWSNVLPYTSV